MSKRSSARCEEPGPKPGPVISLINLGCAKNQADAECLLGNLVREGFLLAENVEDSDLCLVNTCGFVQSARDETAETLAKVAALKSRGRIKAVVALGCMVERAGTTPALAGLVAVADRRVGFREYGELPRILRRLAGAHTDEAGGPAPSGIASFVDFLRSPRLRLGGVHSAYLKISEGCSNACRFCSIPLMRGRQASRPLKDILSEAEALLRSGAKELNLIAQDTTSYGMDLPGRVRLPELLRGLLAQPGDAWIRLMYAYPAHLTDEILEVMASDPRVCPYLDLPLQHVSDAILTAMGRHFTRAQTGRLLARIRERLPKAAIRTAFIVGFPGESDAHFQELLEFVREGHFAHMGVFAYSAEPGTRAESLGDPVPERVKRERCAALMEAQRAVSRARLAGRVGEVTEVLVDGPARPARGILRGIRWAARSRLEAPEVDGTVFLCPGRYALRSGGRLRVRVCAALDYDLVARVEARGGLQNRPDGRDRAGAFRPRGKR